MTGDAGPRTAAQLTARLMALADHDRPAVAPAGFRVDAADDQSVGVRTRDVFALAKESGDLDEVETERRQALCELHLRRHDRIDGWDLVERAAP